MRGDTKEKLRLYIYCMLKNIFHFLTILVNIIYRWKCHLN